jgi:methyltransferase-like protein
MKRRRVTDKSEQEAKHTRVEKEASYIPSDCLAVIFRFAFTAQKVLNKFSLVCREWNQATMELWKDICYSEWPILNMITYDSEVVPYGDWKQFYMDRVDEFMQTPKVYSEETTTIQEALENLQRSSSRAVHHLDDIVIAAENAQVRLKLSHRYANVKKWAKQQIKKNIDQNDDRGLENLFIRSVSCDTN